MGAVRMIVQTADKNITVIHKYSIPVHQITSVNVKSCVCNKFLIKTFLISKCCLKNFLFSKIVLSLVKKLSCLNQVRNMHRSRTIHKWEKRGNRGRTFSYGEVLLCVIGQYFGQKWRFKLKNLNDGFVSYKHTAFCFTRHELMDWSCVDYLWISWCFYQLFELWWQI